MDGPSGSWFLQALNTLREDMRSQHTRQSESMGRLEESIARESGAIQHRLREVENTVLVIKTERDGEKKDALRRGAWAGILAAFGLTAAWEIMKLMFWHKP